MSSETPYHAIPGTTFPAKISRDDDFNPYGDEEPVRRPAKKQTFILRCALLFALILGSSFECFRHGLNLQTVGAFSTPELLMIVSIPVFILAFISGFRLFEDLVRDGRPKWHLWILSLLPAAMFGPGLLRIPDHEEGVARALQASDLPNQLVELAADEIAKPLPAPSWGDKRQEEIAARDPFRKLGLEPFFTIEGSSLICEFGSPLADRWGISISGVRGKSPWLPSYSSNPKVVSKEVIAFTGIKD